MSRGKQEKRIFRGLQSDVWCTQKTAQIIRIITAPPFMIAALLLVLGLIPIGFYTGITDQCVAWIGLVLLPLLAYPLHFIIPELRKTGREGQRKAAFIFSLVGYVMCFAYSFYTASEKLKFVFFVYFFTVVLLTVMNKLLHIRASGHAASAISPCVFSGLYAGTWSCLLFGAVFLLSIWSSLYLKRHKPSDITSGVCAFGLALLLSYWILC